jgi:hypothetical protein
MQSTAFAGRFGVGIQRRGFHLDGEDAGIAIVGDITRRPTERGISCPGTAVQQRWSAGERQPGQTLANIAPRAPARRGLVLKVRSLVAQRALDHDERGEPGRRRDPAGRGDVDHQRTEGRRRDRALSCDSCFGVRTSENLRPPAAGGRGYQGGLDDGVGHFAELAACER